MNMLLLGSDWALLELQPACCASDIECKLEESDLQYQEMRVLYCITSAMTIVEVIG